MILSLCRTRLRAPTSLYPLWGQLSIGPTITLKNIKTSKHQPVANLKNNILFLFSFVLYFVLVEHLIFLKKYVFEFPFFYILQFIA